MDGGGGFFVIVWGVGPERVEFFFCRFPATRRAQNGREMMVVVDVCFPEKNVNHGNPSPFLTMVTFYETPRFFPFSAWQ